MRNRITDYTFTPGSRSITLTKFDAVTVPDLRLIVNETQKYIICSSMQKDLVTCSGNVITFVDTLPALQAGDQLTIEVDTGSDVIYSGGTDWVIEKKLNSIAPTAEQEPWILTEEMGEQLRPLVEEFGLDSTFGRGVCAFFAYSLATELRLNSWKNILNPFCCQWMAIFSLYLTRVDLSSLKTVAAESAMREAFVGCNSLRVVDLRSLQSTQGYAQTFSGTFTNCNSLVEMHIGCGALATNSANSNPLVSATGVFNLTIYGTPLNDIYITWQPLNFASVLRVLQHIANDPDSATGKTLSFKSGLNFTVTQEELDAYNAAKTTVQSTLGWTVQNSPNVHL